MLDRDPSRALLVVGGPALVLVAAVAAGACGASDSQVDRSGATSSSSGGGESGASSGSSATDSGGGSSSSGGASASSGVATGASSSGGSSTSDGSTDAGAASEAGAASCPAQATLVRAIKVSLPVTWQAKSVTQAGSGTAQIWMLDDFTSVSGDALSGTVATCKLELPDVTLNAAVGGLLGGSKVQIEITPATWAKVPPSPDAATMTGWGPPGTIASGGLDLVGLQFASGSSATAAWPTATTGFPAGTTFPDDDQDGNPGILGTPIGSNGFVLPPTDALATAKADQVYIALRIQLALTGAWTDCASQSGSITATFFDNHVVGCHVSGGGACTTGAGSQADFIDSNRTVYVPSAGTFTAKVLQGSATCADVITALP